MQLITQNLLPSGSGSTIACMVLVDLGGHLTTLREREGQTNPQIAQLSRIQAQKQSCLGGDLVWPCGVRRRVILGVPY